MLQFEDFVWPYDAMVWDLAIHGMNWDMIPSFAQILMVRSGGGNPTLYKSTWQSHVVPALLSDTIEKEEYVMKFGSKTWKGRIDYNAMYDAMEARGLFTYNVADDTGRNYVTDAVDTDKQHGDFESGDFKSSLSKVTSVLRKMQPLISMNPLYGPMFNQALDSVDDFSKKGSPEHALMALNVAVDTSNAYKSETGDFRDDLFGHPSVKAGIQDTLKLMKHMKDDPVYIALSQKV